MGVRLVPKLVTLNGVVAIILRYFAEFGSFRDQLCKSGWLAINRCSPNKCQSTPTRHDGCAVLFAVAELLVNTTKFRRRVAKLLLFIQKSNMASVNLGFVIQCC